MSQTQQQIREFVAGIQAYVSPINVINPWRDYVTGYDIGPEAVKIRSEHLVRYLEPRMSKARYIFIAEAVGYQGARFSGVPLTSERMVTGNHSLVNHQMIFQASRVFEQACPISPNLTGVRRCMDSQNRQHPSYGVKCYPVQGGNQRTLYFGTSIPFILINLPKTG